MKLCLKALFFVVVFALYLGSGRLSAYSESTADRVRSAALGATAVPPTATTPTATEPSSLYLGEPSPGDTPVIFAKGIISDGAVHSRLAISPDGKELFWTNVATLKVMNVRYEQGGWTKPQPASFASSGKTTNPLFSPDGTKLFFNYTEDVSKGWRIKYVSRNGSGWTTPKDDGFLLNTSSSFTQSGKVYFSDAMAGKPWNRGIFSAQYSGDEYTNIKALDATINSPYIDYTPYISAADDYLFFSSSRPSPDENMFLYISFRNRDETWTTPQKMNDKMGYSDNARFPSLSPDGKYLFFCGDDGNIYWVSAAIIEQFRP
jgi:Tol biopolymer transport system component